MAKNKKAETIQDIMDRIQEDIDILRDKAQDLEDNQCECDCRLFHVPWSMDMGLWYCG